MKKYTAEFIGTAILTLAIISSIAQGAGFVTVLTAGIALSIIVAQFGGVSGAHVNPAITLGLLSVRKIAWKDAIGYIIAQFAGAALAMILVRLQGMSIPTIDATFSWTALVAEVIATLVFAFGVARAVSISDATIAASRAPFIVGGSLTVGVSIAIILGSNAVLNPAVAFGIASFGIAYVVGPILGAVAGFWLEKVLR